MHSNNFITIIRGGVVSQFFNIVIQNALQSISSTKMPRNACAMISQSE